MSHNQIPTSITVPKQAPYYHNHKELYSINVTDHSVEAMIEFMTWKYPNHYTKEKRKHQYKKKISE